jgi:auxin responsive GH3 family protein
MSGLGKVSKRIRLPRLAAGVVASGVVALESSRFLEKRSHGCSDHHTYSDSFYQFLLWDALSVLSSKAREKHDEDCENFSQVQHDLLFDRLSHNKDTAYGKDHAFEELLGRSKDISEVVQNFRKTHPITRYDHFAPYVDRIVADEEKVLNADGERMLAVTSGISGRRSLIPTTDLTGQTMFLRGIMVVFGSLQKTAPEFFQALQRSCKLAFQSNLESTPSGKLKIGATSSGPNDPGFQKLLPLYSTPVIEGFQIPHDDNAAMYVHALFALLDKNLGIMEGNFVTLPYRLMETIAIGGIAMAEDIKRGKLSKQVADRIGDKAKVAAIEKAMGGPNPRRAKEIREALAGETKGLAKRLWPNFKFVLSNASGPAFQQYAHKLQHGGMLDSDNGVVPIFSTVYAASEGLMGIALDPKPDGDSLFCLVPRAMFFEFLPVSYDGNKTIDPPMPVLSEDLKLDEDYELIVTTLGGLYRYRLGDVVRFKGYHKGHAPLIEFRYRIGQLLNLCGEKTSEPQLAEAMDLLETSLKKMGAGMVEYSSTQVDHGSVHRYVIFVEVNGKSRAMDSKDAAKIMDDALCKENPVYASWRKKRAIHQCEVKFLPIGSFERLREMRIQEGTSPQQLKMSRVLWKKEHIDALINDSPQNKK